MDDPNNQNACILHDSINAFNLTQHVKIPTHNKGHTLDVIITTNSTGFNNVGEIIPGLIHFRPQTTNIGNNNKQNGTQKNNNQSQKINKEYQQHL